MDEKSMECVVCLELCHECINCLRCNQLFCKSHINDMDDKCPYCRDAPFRYQDNIALQRIIRDIRRRKQTEALTCQVPGCTFTGGWADFLKHAVINHQERIVASCMIGAQGFSVSSPSPAPLPPPTPTPEPEPAPTHPTPTLLEAFLLYSPEELPQVTEPVKIALPGRQGHYRKVPTPELHASMSEHTRLCENPTCCEVWTGKWGPFIGGDQGGSRFDLTECLAGRRLNERVGWNYDNPHA